MNIDLKDIIYGLDSFSKLNYETRFQIAQDIIKISPPDKQTIQDIVYKLRDLLRIRSSNLNKAIKDPKRKLKKSEVLNFISQLENNTQTPEKINITKKEKISNIEIPEVVTKPIIATKNKDSIAEKDKVMNNTNLKNIDVNKLKLNADGILKYTDFDLVTLKHLLIEYCKELHCNDFNIIYNTQNNALIIDRTTEDNKISIYKNSKKEIKEIFSLLTNPTKIQTAITTENNKQKNIIKKIDNDKKDEYISIEHDKKIITSKKEDDSLENLLSKETKEFVPKNKDDIEIEKGEDIKIEKKSFLEKNKLNNENEKSDNIEIIEETPEKKIKKEKEIQQLQEPEKNIEPQKNNIIEKIDSDFIIFDDDNIVSYMLENKPEGLIKVVLKNQDINTFTYSFVFTKYLSSLLFQIAKCEGTNIVFREGSWLIIPRYKDDNLFSIENKQSTPELLNKIKEQILSETTSKEEQEDRNRVHKHEKEIVTTDTDDDEVKIKAKKILARLRRIP